MQHATYDLWVLITACSSSRRAGDGSGREPFTNTEPIAFGGGKGGQPNAKSDAENSSSTEECRDSCNYS